MDMCHGFVRLLVVPGVLLLCASSGAAQSASPWHLLIEGGQAQIHRSISRGLITQVGIGRQVDEHNFVQLQVRGAWSGADEGFLTVTSGVRVVFLSEARVTPVVRAGIGLLVEPEFSGFMAEAGGGVMIAAADAIDLLVMMMRGTHTGARGPHALLAGIELRLGK